MTFSWRSKGGRARLACRLSAAAGLLMALLMAPAVPAMAQSLPDVSPRVNLTDAERAWLAENPRLRVFTKTDWSPIDLYSYEGRFRGLSGDYLALIAQRLGIRFEFTARATLAEALTALEAGEAEILPSVSRTPQRERFMDFSRPYLDVPNVYVSRRGVPGVGPEEPMADLRVAVERGYAVEALVRERHPRSSVVVFDDSAQALRGVSEGDADVYLGALPTTSFLVEKLLLTNLEVRSPWHSSLSALHLGVRKGERTLLAILDKALVTITLAERQDIHRRWAPLNSLLAVPSPPLALGADEQRFIATLPALRVGYEADYRPYSFRGSDGRLAGMANDYLRLAADKIGLNVGTPSAGTWSDIYRQAQRGEIDLLIAVAANAEREREFRFVGPWLSTPNVLITPRDAAPVLSLLQYSGRRVAVLRDGQTAWLMRELHPQVSLVEVDTRAALLAAVANGRADAAFVNASFAAPNLAQGLGGALKMAGFFPELNSDLYFGVRRDQPELAALLERAVAAINDSERAAIAARWAVLPEPSDPGREAREAVRRLWPLAAGLLAALALSLLWAAWLKREVARRQAAEAELAIERDHAHRLARARQEFLAEASHEIRTPVNGVLGALGQVAGQPMSAPARELIALAMRAAQTLSEYLNNLLDLGKSDAGELRLVLQSDALAGAVRTALEAIEPMARAKDIELELALDAALAPRHEFDAFRLRQVAVNLLSNAVKFSGEGTVVRVEVRVLGNEEREQRIALTVRDEGQGIPPERLAQLFRPYAQAGDSVAHRSGSTGLGLSLCKRLVEAMHGSIALAPASPRGTVATVLLSLPVADAAPSGPAPLSEALVAEQALRVLVVDDDRVQQILLEAQFARAGCMVHVAASGEAAQTLWMRHRHGLVLSDLQLGGSQDGYALARWLRAQPGGAAVRLIGCSADLTRADEARAAGMERLLYKPVSTATIEEMVAEARIVAGDSAPASPAAGLDVASAG